MAEMSLEEIKNGKVDLEKIPVDEVFKQLKCTRKGLTSGESEKRLQIFGPNKLEEKHENKFLKFLGFMWNPLSWVMESAAIMAIVLANGGGKPPDWQDFIGIVVLLIINSTISFIEENTAGNAAAALMANLAPQAKVLRDGKWQEVEAAVLVPGDVISIKLGDIVPADARLLEGDPLKIDQAALTGESLPVTRSPGDEVFSGSTCKQGEIDAVVIATGIHTFFGKAAHLVDSTNNVGHFQQVLTSIGNFCIISIGVGVVIEVVVMYAFQHREYRAGIDNLLVLLIGGIPIAMPTVLSVTMAIGSHRLSEEVSKTAHKIIANFADRGLRSLAVAYQTIPDKNKDSAGSPWEFVGLLPLFDPPRHDSAETIRRALELGVSVKMITGDQLAIGIETGRRLGMGTNMYPSSALLTDNDESSMTIDELIEKADGFAGVFPEHKYEIVRRLQDRLHIVGMTGDGVNDAPALKKADIGIAVADATDAARSASDIVLTEPGLSVIVSAVLTSRAIFQRMKNYTIYAVSITIRIVFGFLLVALIWKFDFSPFMVLIIAILNDGTIMTISKDRVKPSPVPDSWKLNEIFATGIVLGAYMAIVTVLFFWLAEDTDFFSATFGVKSIRGNHEELTAALYLQVSIISQALIFVTRTRGWSISYSERPGILLVVAFFIAQLLATIIAVYAKWDFAGISGIGWGWAGVIWLFTVVTYIPLDVLKFLIRLVLTGHAWENHPDNQTGITTKKGYGKDEREAQWAEAQRILPGLKEVEAESPTAAAADMHRYSDAV
ncbi:unnamed protein product [Linum tenue]|uniref:Cation-transporting P-type ATPase N-terminal domain-containing protein n=1 Tax=Linum tenue TaxID=586396 RepID=A0AAV0QAA5_9ROSI|nr:unnamed protein product [Linum tenue]